MERPSGGCWSDWAVRSLIRDSSHHVKECSSRNHLPELAVLSEKVPLQMGKPSYSGTVRDAPLIQPVLDWIVAGEPGREL